MLELLPWGLLLLLSAWVYSDAKERGSDSPGMWAFGTFLLMIVVLPLWFIKRKPKVQRLIESKLCPHCGKYYAHTPAFCPNCGQKLDERMSL